LIGFCQRESGRWAALTKRSSTRRANPGCLAYARVSTADQDPRLQIDALTAHGCRRLFVEKISSRAKDRPGLAAALHRLDPGDTLVVWKLDRLGRSVTEVVGLAEQLHNIRCRAAHSHRHPRRHLQPDRLREILLHDHGHLR
jgi:hypothetical protein